VHERRLTDARRTDHGEQRPRFELRERGANLVGATEEELRVVLPEGREAAIRRLILGESTAARREERLEVRDQLGRVRKSLGLLLVEALVDVRD
jgi:hypothetical protein